MGLEKRDELAARMAAALAESGWSAAHIAERAYDLADALLRERGRMDAPVDESPELSAPPHDPRWELEPRWSRADRLAAEQRRVGGPGLASAKPPAEDDDERRVG